MLIKPKFISTDILENQSYIDNPNVFLSAHINKNNICMVRIDYKDNFASKKDETNEKLAIDFYVNNLNSFKWKVYYCRKIIHNISNPFVVGDNMGFS